MALQRVDLRNADPDHLARAARLAAEAIAEDRLVVLPTETVYGVAADPRRPSSVARLVGFKGRPDAQPFTHHVAEIADAERLAAPLSAPARRLAARYWPGPLTLVVAARDGGDVGIRLPAHDFARRVIAEVGSSLYLTSVNRSGEAPLVTPDAIAAGFRDQLDMLCDAGPPPLKLSSTVVRLGRGSIEVLREGILTRDEVLAVAATTVLFVCTGNTCRSPLAEVLARRLAAEHLGVEPHAVAERGLRFVSAGLAAAFGAPASEGATLVAAEVSCNLDGHVAQPLSREQVQQASRVYCMTDAHAARVRALAPEAADRVTTLRPDGGDVADPFGGSTAQYRSTREEIAHALAARWEEIADLDR
ncbi:MAG: Sua5/YciO/YrdC/YwlC family protein [Planctomycetota bacterium]